MWNTIVKTVTATAKSIKPVVVELSPKILLITGLGCILGGTAWACYQTATKLEPIAEGHKQEVTEIAEVVSDDKSDETRKSMALKELSKSKIRYVLDVVKVYVGPVSLIAVGTGSICLSHSILNARYLAASAALQSTIEAYSQYREKMTEKLGAERVAQLETELEEERSKSNAANDKKTLKLNGIVRHFNRHTAPTLFKKYQPYNYDFLRSVQAMANRRLQNSKNGILFANEVIEMFDGEKTELGCIVGWCREDGDYVDFGLDSTLSNTRNLTDNLHDVSADWTITLNCSKIVSTRLESDEYKFPYNKIVAELREEMYRDNITTEDYPEGCFKINEKGDDE